MQLSKKNLKRVYWVLISAMFIGIILGEAKIFSPFGWVIFVAAFIITCIISYGTSSSTFDADELEDWEKTRAYGLKSHLLGAVGRGFIIGALFLTYHVAENYFNNKPAIDALRVEVIAKAIFFICLSPALAYEGWRSGEAKFEKMQSLQNP